MAIFGSKITIFLSGYQQFNTYFEPLMALKLLAGSAAIDVLADVMDLSQQTRGSMAHLKHTHPQSLQHSKSQTDISFAAASSKPQLMHDWWYSKTALMKNEKRRKMLIRYRFQFRQLNHQRPTMYYRSKNIQFTPSSPHYPIPSNIQNQITETHHSTHSAHQQQATSSSHPPSSAISPPNASPVPRLSSYP